MAWLLGGTQMHKLMMILALSGLEQGHAREAAIPCHLVMESKVLRVLVKVTATVAICGVVLSVFLK